jgi:surfactin synthase thioesterase subunit
MGDELCSNFSTVIENIVTAVKQLEPLPTVYFGHSLGGLMAFETAQQLEAEGRHAPPLKLVLSACYPPHIDKSGGKGPAWKQDDAHFIEELKSLNGTPDEVLKSPELLELFLPLLRSDFQLVHEARTSIGGRIKIPLAILGGADDNITPDELQQWAGYTSGSVSLQMFPGDHFFLNNHRNSVCSSVWAHVAEVLSASARREGAFAQSVRV